MAKELEHLQLARRHLAQAEDRVRRQEDLVDRLEAGGHPTELARALLVSFEETMQQMRAHRDYLEREAIA